MIIKKMVTELMGINTKLIHPNKGSVYGDGATLPSVSQVNAFVYDTSEKLERVFRNKAPGYAYTRIGNPTVNAFEERICEAEGGIGAVSCASGMSAVTLSILNILRAGDEVIASAALFGGTLDLFSNIESFGIKTVFADIVDPEHIEPLITEKTRAVFAEVIGNPGLNILDIKKTADFLHEKGIPLIVDSTTATPVLVRPLSLGADIVIHSTSKYINGSSNSIGGVIIDGGSFKWEAERYPDIAEYAKYGRFAYLTKLKNTLWRNIGPCLSPANAYLNILGLETLGLRMERACNSAYELALALNEIPGVDVNYPLLENNPQRELALAELNGFGGAVFTLRTGSKERAFRFTNALKYAHIASNIGDVRTLVIHPASTIFIHSTEEKKAQAGCFEDLVRVSVGIEDAEDLKEDFIASIRKLEEQE